MAPRRRAWQWAQCGRWKGWGTALAASRAGAGGRRRVGGVPEYMRAASGRGAKWCEWAGSAMPGRPAAHEGRRRRSASGGGRCRGGGQRGRRPTAPARCAGPAGCPCSRLLCAPPRCATLRPARPESAPAAPGEWARAVRMRARVRRPPGRLAIPAAPFLSFAADTQTAFSRRGPSRPSSIPSPVRRRAWPACAPRPRSRRQTCRAVASGLEESRRGAARRGPRPCGP